LTGVVRTKVPVTMRLINNGCILTLKVPDFILVQSMARQHFKPKCVSMSLPNENPPSFINNHNFPGGRIQVAVVFIDGIVYHAYRLYRAYGSDQWYAPIAGNSAEAATKLAYGRGKIMGREKTALEVWSDMLPYLVPIPMLDE
jgi:hypothetical protein